MFRISFLRLIQTLTRINSRFQKYEAQGCRSNYCPGPLLGNRTNLTPSPEKFGRAGGKACSAKSLRLFLGELVRLRSLGNLGSLENLGNLESLVSLENLV